MNLSTCGLFKLYNGLVHFVGLIIDPSTLLDSSTLRDEFVNFVGWTRQLYWLSYEPFFLWICLLWSWIILSHPCGMSSSTSWIRPFVGQIMNPSTCGMNSSFYGPTNSDTCWFMLITYPLLDELIHSMGLLANLSTLWTY